MARYSIISCHVLWRELCFLAAQSPHLYYFHFLKQGLHNTPEILKQELQSAIDQNQDESEAILVGYGLCSNGLAGITAKNKPLVVMRGHDCITFFLGSKERYSEYFNQNPGTYWYTPGWIETGFVPSAESLKNKSRDYEKEYGKENADYLMEIELNGLKNYSRAAYIDTGITDASKYIQYSHEAARHFGWSFEKLQSELNLMRDFMQGNWDNERFLVVQPGDRIEPAYDDSIIKSEKQ
jgi:hypothetical protein